MGCDGKAAKTRKIQIQPELSHFKEVCCSAIRWRTDRAATRWRVDRNRSTAEVVKAERLQGLER